MSQKPDSDWEEAVRSYPTALEFLSSPEAFDPDSPESRLDRFTRNVIGSEVPEGTPVDQGAIAEYWVTTLADRILDNWDNCTLITGEPGVGKSNLGIWWCVRLKDRLGMETGTSRDWDPLHDKVTRLSDLEERVYQSSRANPWVGLIDEGVLTGAQAGAGLSPQGRILDRTLTICRAKCASLFLLIPNPWGLAAFARMRRIRYWAHVESRGVATMFEVSDRLEFKRPNALPFQKVRRPWSRLEFPSLEETDSKLWAKYSVDKMETIAEVLVDSEMEAARLEAKEGMRPRGPKDMQFYDKGAGGRERPADPMAERIRELRAGGAVVREIKNKLHIGQKRILGVLAASEPESESEDQGG